MRKITFRSKGENLLSRNCQIRPPYCTIFFPSSSAPYAPPQSVFQDDWEACVAILSSGLDEKSVEKIKIFCRIFHPTHTFGSPLKNWFSLGTIKFQYTFNTISVSTIFLIDFLYSHIWFCFQTPSPVFYCAQTWIWAS